MAEKQRYVMGLRGYEARDRVFQKLATLIKNRFDKNITFTDLEINRLSADPEISSMVKRNSMAKVLIRGGDIVMPVMSANKLFGYITLYQGTRLDESDIDQVREITDLIFTQTCTMTDEALRLQELETHLATQMSEINNIGDKSSALNELIFEDPTIHISESAQNAIHFPVLIEAHKENDARELAIEIHKDSGRTTFVTFENYLAAHCNTIQGLQEFGPFTLYVPNVELVPLDVQLAMARFLNTVELSPKNVRLVFSTINNPEEMAAEGKLARDLFNELKDTRIRLPSKDTNTMSLEEILEFFSPSKANHQGSETKIRPKLTVITGGADSNLH